MATIHTTIYKEFRGVDFSSDATLVDKSRSPSARNLISDVGGMPEKRPGWRIVANVGDEGAAVHGLFDAVIDGVSYFLAHIGTGIYLFNPAAEGGDGVLTLLYACQGNQRSVGVNLCGKLWILTGAEYLVFDGRTVAPVSSVAYVPTTLISTNPSGGGTWYESINLLTASRKNSFLADGEAVDYYLDSANLDRVEAVTVDGVAYPDVSSATEQAEGDGVQTVFTLQTQMVLTGLTARVNGQSVSITASLPTTGGGTATFSSPPAAGSQITFIMVPKYYWQADLQTGKVTFAAAPPAPLAGAADTVVIQFAKEVGGYSAQISTGTIISTYGVGSRDRVVISGNPTLPNRDFTSGYNDPTYFPDDGYNVVGSEATAIKGYAPIGAYMAIIKEDNGQDATVYLRSAALDSEGTAMFPTVQGVSGVGAVSQWAIGLINDEPVFLSGTGLYALTSDVITAERIVKNRSYYLNGWLSKEHGLNRAIAVRWNGYFLIALNNVCYILDGAGRKSYWVRGSGDFVYEGYYWDNIPANCFLNHRQEGKEILYFGTEDGKICRFNDDIEDMSRYEDGGHLTQAEGRTFVSGGEAVKALWSTCSDDDGDPTRLKTMIKPGCAVTLKPFARSGGMISFRSDHDVAPREISETLDLFDFNDINFERFSFDTNDAPKEIFFRTKVKKYKRLQIIAANDNIDEGFGIFAITKHYVVGNYAKR